MHGDKEGHDVNMTIKTNTPKCYSNSLFSTLKHVFQILAHSSKVEMKSRFIYFNISADKKEVLLYCSYDAVKLLTLKNIFIIICLHGS